MTFEVTSACIGCGRCVKDCAMGILTLEKGRPTVRPDRADSCMNCQHCLAVCPKGAVCINGCDETLCQNLNEMPIPPPNELANLIRSRRSVRQFAAVDVPQADIAEILETLKYVPTGCNIRHLVFKVVATGAKMDELRRRTYETLASHLTQLPERLASIVLAWQKNNQTDVFFRGARHLLIVYGSPDAVTPQVDCDAACAYFDMLAQASGLGTTWFGFFTHIAHAVPEILDIFGIPRNATYHAMLFGEPLVDYVRCVNRADGAQIQWEK